MTLPRAIRKAASHIGGMPVVLGGQNGWVDMPHAFDPGNTVYARAYDLLCDDVGLPDIDHPCRGFNDETKGDLLEALLGAAMVTAASHRNGAVVYGALIGGDSLPTDLATKVLVEIVENTIEWLNDTYERDPWISTRWQPDVIVAGGEGVV